MTCVNDVVCQEYLIRTPLGFFFIRTFRTLTKPQKGSKFVNWTILD